MKNNELITIVIPIYNVEKYISRCIDSVINQTYQNIEIILIDDGSPDNCPLICDDYQKMDKRIKVIHKENGGLSDARNVGIKNATGKYITFIDSDDYIENDYIEYLYSLIRKYHTNISICANYLIKKNKTKSSGTGYKEMILEQKECIKRMLLNHGFSVSAWSKLYNISLFKDIEYPKGKIFEDNGTTYKLIMKCKNIAYGEKAKYCYIIRDDSITTSNFNEKKMALIELTDEMCDAIDNKYIDLSDYTTLKKIESRFSILRLMIFDKKYGKGKEINDIISYIKSNWKFILNNKLVPLRDRIAMIILFGGTNAFKITFWIYSKIT